MEIKKLKKLIKISKKYKYDENNILGTGSFSNVFLGYDNDGNNVSVKKINLIELSQSKQKAVSKEIEIIELFLNEKRYNENIVKFYDIIYNYNKTIIYVIMEYCDCNTLKSLLIKPFKENYIYYYIKQILNGLLYLKKNNIIHRDIKPSNILLTNNYRTVKICDFSLSKIKKSKYKSKDISCGSLSYMAPEILNNHKYSYNVDLWALGMISYEMLNGYHYYKGTKDINLIKILSQNIIINKRQNINNSCYTFIRKLLDRKSKVLINIEKIMEMKWINDNIDNIDNINNKDKFSVKDIYYDNNNDISLLENKKQNNKKIINMLFTSSILNSTTISDIRN
jgi:serine/threonine protein kinase